MTLPEWGRKVLLLAIIPVPHELSDRVSEISSLKDSDKYKSVLSFFDLSVSVNIIVNKLLAFMQNKWTDRALKYKKRLWCALSTFQSHR